MTEPVTAIQAEAQQYRHRIDQLLLYRGIWQTPVGQGLVGLLTAVEQGDPGASLRAYGNWFQALTVQGESWPHYLLRQIAYADNAFTTQAQIQDYPSLPQALVQAACHDLAQLQALYHLRGDRLAQWVQTLAQLPQPPVVWHLDTPPPVIPLATSDDWPATLPQLAQHYQRHGAGPFAQYRAFTWHQGCLQGIAHPDPITLGQLAAYDHPRQQLIQNTQALLKGYGALNVLLYGSRGTGKSSLVKALVNDYAPQGLRLVEVPKGQLQALPQIADQLRSRPQKFIIFVDDLSFEEDDDSFKALKVVLEGGVTARPANLVVYATSNRRHLVREYFSDRPRPSDQDEVQSWDTMQEKLSFSDRFGLTLTFEPTDQPTYLTIVHHLAGQAQIDLADHELRARALQWATRHNGRSGRTAKQFIDWLVAEQGLNP
jgi:predicted AAA+ superfamily ATPase